MSDVLVTLRPDPVRRFIGIGTLAGLGGLLIWIGFSDGPLGPVLRLVFLAAGAVALWATAAMRRATRRGLELTAEELREAGGGRTLARVSEIRGVERGPFALKPSGGFVLRMDRGAPAAWVPGIWWRLGRRIGVGGIVGTNAAKAMAEALALTVAERRG